jgi:hypothetical protein
MDIVAPWDCGPDALIQPLMESKPEHDAIPVLHLALSNQQHWNDTASLCPAFSEVKNA